MRIKDFKNLVSFNGDYNSLLNKPTIPSQLSQLSTDTNNQRVSETEKATYTNKADQSYAIAMAVAL